MANVAAVYDAKRVAGEGVGQPIGVDTIYIEDSEEKICSETITDGDFVSYVSTDQRKVQQASTTAGENMTSGIALIGTSAIAEGAGTATAAADAVIKVIKRGRHPNANILTASGALGRIVQLTATPGQATNAAEAVATGRLGYMLEAGTGNRASVWVCVP